MSPGVAEDNGGDIDGAERLSNPLAIISKKRLLVVKFRARRWSAASKGFVRRGLVEHRTVMWWCDFDGGRAKSNMR